MKKRILIVDDEAALTNGIRLNLEEAGSYEVREENRAAQAIVAARQFVPDLILLDIMMPGLDGSELAAELNGDESLSRIPIIFLTALVTEIEVQHGWTLISGGRTFMPKPVRIPELIECIERLTTARDRVLTQPF